MSKINVAVLFGGKSSEHEVSRVSALAIIKNLSLEKYNLFIIGITKKGEWYLYQGDIDKISSNEWENDNNNEKVLISPDPSVHGLLLLNGSSYKEIKIDVIIPALHGKNGEDGKMQGLFELSGIPFVGCNTCASAACMDKTITSTVLVNNGVKKPRFFWFYYNDFKKDKNMVINNIEYEINSYPMFVKPANSGSSVGISKALNKDELILAIEAAREEDEKIIVEQMIKGKEVECAVIGNEEPMASIVGEIDPGADFYDYSAKYINDTSKLYIPARVSNEISKEIRNIAIRAYKIMGCRGLARVDFLIDEKTNGIFLNEINTFPGFTPISMYSKLMEQMGMKFSDLVDEFINLALEKQVALAL